MNVAAMTSVGSESLFDEHGRCLPGTVKAPAHQRTRRRFTCAQPVLDYAAIHDRITRYLSAEGALSVTEFQQRVEAILDAIRQNPQTATLDKGAVVPFFLPQIADALQADIGQQMESRFIPAVEKAFLETYPQQAFKNHFKGSLQGRLSVAPGSRHERLLQAAQQGPVVGCLFLSLQEFSIPAALEKVGTLPESFLLGGGYDLCAAMIGSPAVLRKPDSYPPLLWFAALEGENPDVGYHMEAYGNDLTFNRRKHFGQAAEYWCSALTVLG